MGAGLAQGGYHHYEKKFSYKNCIKQMWFSDFPLSQLFANNAAAPKGAPAAGQ